MAIESQHVMLSLLRLARGPLQMTGAVCSGVLLYETGISTVTLGATVVTTSFAALSIALFAPKSGACATKCFPPR